MKRQTILLLPLAAMIAAPSWSRALDDEGTFTVTPSFVSDFMFRGARLGGFSFQPMVEYSKGSLDLGLWCNFPLADKRLYQDVYSDPEFDLTASYTWSIVPDVFTIKPGFTLYTYPRAKKEDGFFKATVEPNVSFGYAVGPMSFSANFYYDIVMEGPTYEFGVDCSIPAKVFEIELSALIGTYDWSDSVAGETTKYGLKGNYWQAGIAIPFEFSENSKLTVGWYYAKGLNNKSYWTEDGSKIIETNPDIGRGVFNVSFSQSF